MAKHGWPRKSMVDAEEVNHLTGELLLADIVWLAKGDAEPDTPEGHYFVPQDDPIEQCLAGAQATPWDAHPI